MNGLELIKHSGGGGPMTVLGTGVSVVKEGKIEFTNATEVIVDDCFSTNYDNYLMIVRGAVSSGRPNISLRPSQSDGTSYAFQELNVSGSSSPTGSRNPSASFWNGGPEAPSLPGGSHYYFYGPWLRQPTAFRCVTANTVSSASIRDYAGTVSGDKQYTGFRFWRTSGTMTGSLTIYGYTKGITP